MKKVVVTGAHGFVGRNLCVYLRDLGGVEVIEVTRDTDLSAIKDVPVDCVVHLAGVSRPVENAHFFRDNSDATEAALATFKPARPGAKFLFASTIRVVDDTAYAQSKRAAEDCIQTGGVAAGWAVDILRLPNLFGKWSRPYHNSFVPTFIDQVLNDEPLTIHDPRSTVELLYIDDLIEVMLPLILEEGAKPEMRLVESFPAIQTTVGEVAAQLQEFRDKFDSPWMIDVSDPFKKRLNATFLSYIGLEGRQFRLTVIESDTGSFCEVYKREDFGQVSVLVIEPGALRGNHYHHTKCENFFLVKGSVNLSEIDLQRNESDGTVLTAGTSFWTRPGCLHTLENTGDCAAVFLIWANEVYERDRPDTWTTSAELE